jgi:hypothetical protein
LILKAGVAMAAVAERFVGAVAAAAEGDHSSPAESELVPLGIHELEIAFHAKWTVIVDGNLDWHSILPPAFRCESR